MHLWLSLCLLRLARSVFGTLLKVRKWRTRKDMAARATRSRNTGAVSAANTDGRSTYLDIQSIAAFLTKGGLAVSIVKEVVDEKTRLTLMSVIGEQHSPILVPLNLYDSAYDSISVKEMRQAIEMTRATLPELPVKLYGRSYDSVLIPLTSYIANATRLGHFSTVFALINGISARIGKRILIASTVASLGPKGSPISTVTLQIDGKDIARPVCVGKDYTLSCSTQRFVESLVKTADVPTMKLILTTGMCGVGYNWEL